MRFHCKGAGRRGVVIGVVRVTTKFMVDFVDFTGKTVVCCVVVRNRKKFLILAYGEAILRGTTGTTGQRGKCSYQ
jgi:hypothetical protein